MNNQELERIAKSVRKRIFQFTTKSGFGHLASSLSCVDILTSLYYDEKTIFNHKKDVLIFSKTHGKNLLRFGLPERFIFENATRDYLLDHNGLSVDSIFNRIVEYHKGL